MTILSSLTYTTFATTYYPDFEQDVRDLARDVYNNNGSLSDELREHRGYLMTAFEDEWNDFADQDLTAEEAFPANGDSLLQRLAAVTQTLNTPERAALTAILRDELLEMIGPAPEDVGGDEDPGFSISEFIASGWTGSGDEPSRRFARERWLRAKQLIIEFSG